jgi:hypothetical protein
MALTSLLNNLICHFIYSHPLLGTSTASDLSYQHQPCVYYNESHTHKPVIMNLREVSVSCLLFVAVLNFSIMDSWDHSHVLHLMAHMTTLLLNNLILTWLYLFIYFLGWSVGYHLPLCLFLWTYTIHVTEVLVLYWTWKIVSIIHVQNVISGAEVQSV